MNEKILNTILNGDCLEKLKDIEDNSIDSIVTDPPYELSEINPNRQSFAEQMIGGRTEEQKKERSGFLGRKWDVLPPVAVWKECLRVLKPGAFAFIMTTPRQDSLCKLLLNLTEAGFNMSFSSIYWSYASGLPKAINISKVIDRREGVEPTIIGTAQHHDFKDKGKKSKERFGLNKIGIGLKSKNASIPITEPTSDLAKKFDGAYGGYQPKPAIECILVCMKPREKKAYTDQALDNGHGITFLGDCRIPLSNNTSIEDKRLLEGGSWSSKEGMYSGGYAGNRVQAPMRKTTKRKPRKEGTVLKESGFKSEDNNIADVNPAGRFPSNLLVSDDSLNNSKKQTVGYGNVGGGTVNYSGVGEKGTVESYSRYFDLDRWFEERIKELPDDIKKTFPTMIVPKPSTAEKNIGLVNESSSTSYNKKCKNCGRWQIAQKSDKGGKYKCKCVEPNWEELSGNVHVTVKPVKLMAYLVILGSREGDVVLDPFTGSGTTLLASMMLGRNFIGIEREEDYIKVANKRIAAIDDYIEEFKNELLIKYKSKRNKFW